VTQRDPLTGAEVVVVGTRQGRPLVAEPADGCPFCPGGTEAPEPYDVRSFANRWPPLPDGRAEVVLYSPVHEASFASLGITGVRSVVDLWAERTAALGARPDVAYVLLFENRGPEVGATVAHPHGQIYAFDHVPPAPWAELAAEGCGVCREMPPERQVVARSGGWRAWVPTSASWPYELRLAPGAHVGDLRALDGGERDAMAAVLVDALGRLDRLFGGPMPYLLWVHQRPTDGRSWPKAHLHVHVAPLLRDPGTPRFVASGELGSGVFFNPVDPREAAEALRAV
jgi:UDPglucose--hexose-1-phosphate uridylyltransferase